LINIKTVFKLFRAFLLEYIEHQNGTVSNFRLQVYNTGRLTNQRAL